MFARGTHPESVGRILERLKIIGVDRHDLIKLPAEAGCDEVRDVVCVFSQTCDVISCETRALGLSKIVIGSRILLISRV